MSRNSRRFCLESLHVRRRCYSWRTSSVFGFRDFFSGWKEIGPLCRDLLPKRKLFLQRNERFGGGQTDALRALPPPSGSECRQKRRIHNFRQRAPYIFKGQETPFKMHITPTKYIPATIFQTVITVRVYYLYWKDLKIKYSYYWAQALPFVWICKKLHIWY